MEKNHQNKTFTKIVAAIFLVVRDREYLIIYYSGPDVRLAFYVFLFSFTFIHSLLYRLCSASICTMRDVNFVELLCFHKGARRFLTKPIE